MADTSAFANTGGGTNPNPTVLSPQQQVNGTIPGGISNMVKALMEGNDAYKQQQAKQAAAAGQPQISSAGMAPPGAPMSLTPPTDPTSMPGGLGTPTSMQGMAPSPPAAMGATSMAPPASPGFGSNDAFMNGTNPVSIDPVTQALFSPVPAGVTGG
jgi:hypothetical protein